MEVCQHFVLAKTTRKLQYVLFKLEFKIPMNALAFLQKQSIVSPYNNWCYWCFWYDILDEVVDDGTEASLSAE